MKPNDVEPVQQTRIETIAERRTVDLCAHQIAKARCIREHGHDGMHECPVWYSDVPLRWT